MIRKTVASIVVVAFLSLAGLFAAGDYVYRTGTAVRCGHHPYHDQNTPARFFVPGVGQGPFRGTGWDRWVGHDLSAWWLTDRPYQVVRFLSLDSTIDLEAWWIPARDAKETAAVIVAHGINTSRKDFNTLLPAVMLVRHGFNVLLMDLRDAGGSRCEDGRHSAGQQESDDLIAAAHWLEREHAIPLSRVGIHGVSGGAIAALIVAAKNDGVAAFSLEAPIFDFNAAAEQEVKYQGFPGLLWRLAYWAAGLRGVDLNAIEPREGIANLNGRPIQVFHGTVDSRVDYENSLALVDYAKEVGADVALYTIDGADHTEGILLNPELYDRALGSFFQAALFP